MKLERLEEILSVKRGYNSLGDYWLRGMIVDAAPTAVYFATPTDDPLCLVVTIPTTDNKFYPVLWSAHTDTVHITPTTTTHHPEPNAITFDADTMLAYKRDAKDPASGCLGADDGAGVWLLLEMIDANVPGTYVFHYGEERGGIGSRGMAQHHADWLKTFTHAVAFDRRGTDDVITHQAGGRCCSDTFAKRMADLLGHAYKPCDTGVFTDTANYIEDIAECTNISCGYYAEHSSGEYLDLAHLISLRDRLVQVFQSAPELPVERKPGPIQYDAYDYSFTPQWRTASSQYSTREVVDLYHANPRDVANMSFRKLQKLCRADPDGAADILQAFADQIVELEALLDFRGECTDDLADSLVDPMNDPFYYDKKAW